MAFFAFTRLMAVCSALALAWILGHLLPRFRRGLRHASILCEWCDCRIPVCLGDNAPSSRVNEIQRAGAVKGGPTAGRFDQTRLPFPAPPGPKHARVALMAQPDASLRLRTRMESWT